MFNVGSGEIIFIAVAALLLLGPKRLPELARGIGKFMREFRRQTDEVRHVVEREFYKMDQQLTLNDSLQPPRPNAPAAGAPALPEPPGPVLQPNVDALPAVSDAAASQLMAGAAAGTPVEASAPAEPPPGVLSDSEKAS